ncbi:MAG: histidine phosphatase family protein [Pseudomonadota bacterium]
MSDPLSSPRPLEPDPLLSPEPNAGPVLGPIIVSRHGRPALDRTAGPRLGWKAYRGWWARYEEGGLAEGQAPPPALVEAVRGCDVVLTSERLRAQQTAALAAGHRPAEIDGVFNEAPLPPPRLIGVRYLPKTWNILARTAWLAGHSLDGETVGEARRRASRAADRLHEAARAGKVYLAAHGWFNRMLRPQLKARGWREIENGGDQYWSFRVYTHPGGAALDQPSDTPRASRSDSADRTI